MFGIFGKFPEIALNIGVIIIRRKPGTKELILFEQILNVIEVSKLASTF